MTIIRRDPLICGTCWGRFDRYDQFIAHDCDLEIKRRCFAREIGWPATVAAPADGATGDGGE